MYSEQVVDARETMFTCREVPEQKARAAVLLYNYTCPGHREWPRQV